MKYFKTKTAHDSPQALKVEPIPYKAWQTVALTVAIFFASQLLAVVLIGVYAGIKGWSSEQAVNWSTSSVYAQFWTVLVLEATATYLLVVVLKRRKASLQTIGLVRAKLLDVGRALAGFAVYFPVLLATTQIINTLVPSINVDQKQNIGFSTTTSGLPLVAVFISLVILPPLVEELLFRGFLYGGLRNTLKFWPAALITSFLFAMPHILGNETGSTLLWIAGVDTFLLSLVLVYLREKNGSLWPGIFLHMLKNLIAFLSLFVFHVV